MESSIVIICYSNNQRQIILQAQLKLWKKVKKSTQQEEAT